MLVFLIYYEYQYISKSPKRLNNIELAIIFYNS